MNESEINSILEQAIDALFERQPNIFEFTPETGQTEWNLAHHFAIELCRFFPSLDHDLDVVKWNYGNRRPDIILHKRGTHAANFLVVEMKRDCHPQEIEAEVHKINEHWFREPLLYKFGAVVNLRTKGPHEIRLLKNTLVAEA